MKPWHAQVIEMRRQKMTVLQICAALQRESYAVRWVLDENNEKQQARERARRSRSSRSSPKPAPKAVGLPKGKRSVWHAEARSLHASGMSIDDIAAKFGKTSLYVQNVIRGITGGGDVLGAGTDASFIQRHSPRAIRESCPDTMAACRAFASGEIDRFELSRRLRGQS
jgi:hypothetical protein